MCLQLGASFQFPRSSHPSATGIRTLSNNFPELSRGTSPKPNACDTLGKLALELSVETLSQFCFFG